MPEFECKLVNHIDVGTGQEGKPPCEICATVEKVKDKLSELWQVINQSEAMQDYKKAVKEFRALESSHKKCKGCGLCFGGKHVAYPVQNYPTLGYVCQWCDIDIKKVGLKKWTK